MNLGPGKEFDRIRAIFNSISELSPEAEGLGDDCALVPLGTTTLAVSMDASLEGVHFRTDWLDFKEIGFRAAGAALSDLLEVEPVGAEVDALEQIGRAHV